MTIQPGQSKATVEVPIVDDRFFEGPEEFTVELEIPPESADLHVVSGSPKPVPVMIEDDDGASEFEFIFLFTAPQSMHFIPLYVHLICHNPRSCRLMIIWMLINSVADGLVLKVAMCWLQIWKLQFVVRLDVISPFPIISV